MLVSIHTCIFYFEDNLDMVIHFQFYKLLINNNCFIPFTVMLFLSSLITIFALSSCIIPRLNTNAFRTYFCLMA